MKKLLICLSLLAFGLVAQEEDTNDVEQEVTQSLAQAKGEERAIVLKPLERRSIEWYKSFKYYKNDKILQALVAQYSMYRKTPDWLWELLDWHLSLYGNTKYGVDDRIKEARERTPSHRKECLKQVWDTQKYIDNIVEPVQGILTKVHNPRINGLLVVLMDEPSKFGYFVPYCLVSD
jgi:hypothetical protein